MCQTADFAFLESPRMISHKIWVIEKSWNFHTVNMQWKSCYKGGNCWNCNSSELKNSILVLHCSDATKSIWNTYLDMHDWELHWQKKLMYWTIVWFHCQIGFFQWWIMCWFSVHIKKNSIFYLFSGTIVARPFNHVLMIILGVFPYA